MSVLLCAIAFGVSLANTQTESPDQGRWPTCGYTAPAEEHQSGPNFTVRVSFRDQPIVGVKVILSIIGAEFEQDVGQIVATASTDSGGVAHFFAIPSGTYRAHVEKALLAPSKEIQVHSDNGSESRVDIEWPDSPITTGHLRGRIFSWQKSSPQNRADLLPHKNAFVQLLDLRSGKPLASVYTDSKGYYEFPTHADGSYVIRVGEHAGPNINSYDSAVEVTTDMTQGDMTHVDMPNLIVDEICGNGMVAMMDQADAKSTPSLEPAATK